MILSQKRRDFFYIEKSYYQVRKPLHIIKHNLLIKELTTKTNGRNYLRLAVRNKEDNDASYRAYY